MAYINENYNNLQKNYLFSNIAKKVAEFKTNHPDAEIIRLGIGDVTRPLAPAVVEAMSSAVAEMGTEQAFRGYGPDFGYDFLINAILEHDYAARGISLDFDEIFVSDGAKSDVGNIGDIFSSKNSVLISDPVYPVYLDTNIMAGRKVNFTPLSEKNGFSPDLPENRADLIYLCSPNNPTGAAMNRSSLKKWVDFANENESVILFDSAYEAYISEEDIPHSIYEIEGAKSCAIEFRSFSKTAGFTGTRCAYTVIPKELMVGGVSLNALWARRQATKFNGVSYIVQRGAQAVYTPQGQVQIKETIAYYMQNASIILDGLKDCGIKAYGGINAPYIWLKCPGSMKSWDYFDLLLTKINVIGTPGQGFGEMGEGFFRLTAFGTRENTIKSIERIKSL